MTETEFCFNETASLALLPHVHSHQATKFTEREKVSFAFQKKIIPSSSPSCLRGSVRGLLRPARIICARGGTLS